MTKTVFPQHFNFICNSKSKILRFMIIETVKQDFLKKHFIPPFYITPISLIFYSENQLQYCT